MAMETPISPMIQTMMTEHHPPSVGSSVTNSGSNPINDPLIYWFNEPQFVGSCRFTSPIFDLPQFFENVFSTSLGEIPIELLIEIHTISAGFIMYHRWFDSC